MQDLIDAAKAVLGSRELAPGNWAGSVAAAIESDSGRIYTGVCIDVPCSMGFCAEHAAIAAMVTAGEKRIRRCIAVYEDGSIVAPCGRCREFMYQIDHDNLDALIGIRGGTVTLRELLPHIWNM